MFKRIAATLISYNYKRLDLLLYFVAIVLGCIGSYTIYVMPNMAEGLYLKQLVGVFVGIFFAIVVSLFNYRFWTLLSIPIYLLDLALLFAVKFTRFGLTYWGATRWLGIKDVFSFQPSELTKFVMIICLAKLYDLFKNKMDKFYVFILAVFVFAPPLGLIMLQPDLSTSIVLCVMFAMMLFSSGFNIKYIIAMLVIVVPLGIFGFWYVQQPDPMFITSNQQLRILAWLHPEQYPDEMYQQLNSLKAIGSGGLLGKTLTGDTGPRGTVYVAVRESDFIFTGICEEFGFLGALVVITLFAVLTFRMIKIAINAKDLMGRLIATGCVTIFLSQAFVNMSVATLIFPNTGISLPFVSNGLSSAVSSYFMLGMVENIAINTGEVKVRESEDYIR